jgi:F420-dependent oxidoreductase-like protein
MIEGQNGVTWPQWRALAEACEAHGIGALYRSDHYLELSGQHPERGSLDAWATLSALAAVTESVRLGPLVSPATFRHPSELAKVVATADQISGGRIDFGLGAGWHEREHAAYGFEFPELRTRMDILEEQLQVVLGHWAEQRFDFSGEHYRLDGLDALPKPVQRPRPHVIMGGNAGPRSARMAAAYADEYNTAFPSLDDIAVRWTAVERACEAAGREPLSFSIMTTVIVGESDADLRARVRRVAERVGGDADALLADPPESWVLGTLGEAAEQLRRRAAAGVDRVMCQHLAHDDLEFVELLGRRLAPLVG